MSAADFSPVKETASPELSASARAALLVAWGFAVSLAFCWSRVVDIWTTGNFYDSDDAMRIAQVRDWLGGQAWYDLTQWRLDAPRGSLMHWSRVVDLPLGALMRMFQFFATGEAGEKLARIVFPLSLQLTLLASVAWCARVVLGERGIAPAIALAVLSGFMLSQFVPGRVDHHAPQIILLVLMTASMAAALDGARARLAAVSAFCAALSLAISIENLLFIFAIFATPPLTWIFRGRAARPLLLWFAGGLAISIPLCLGVFVAPSRWFAPACDAFSSAYAAIALGAAVLCGGLVLARRFETTFYSRAAATAVLGAVVGAPLSFAYLHCLIDPFEGLDPLVRDIWLNNVGEARPALRHFAMFPRSVQMIVIPTLFGLLGLALASWRSTGIGRARFLLVLAIAAMGCLGTGFMIRVSTSLAPIAVIGCAWLALRAGDALSGKGRAAATIATFAAVLPMSSIGWAMVPSLLPEPTQSEIGANECLARAAFAPLAQLPPGKALASIEVGGYLLAHTPHSVVAASYHRNNHGNRAAIDAFAAPPDVARDLVRGVDARYLLICPSNKEIGQIAARWPHGLAAGLLRDPPLVPEWLRPVPISGTPYKVFVVE